VRILGYEISRVTKASVSPMGYSSGSSALMPVRSSGGVLGMILESFSGAWQKNVTAESSQNLLAFSAVYSCVTLIANDIAKLRPMLMSVDGSGISTEVVQSPLLPVLRKPNHYQNRIQFVTSWVVSKLLYGNAYVYMERDARNVVISLYVLDPRLVTPMVAQNGDVYYQINSDPLSLIPQPIAAVPASEVIHDRMPAIWHPLLGVSPISACGASATQGIRIQANSASFFENMSRPSGILTAPGHIPDDTALRLKTAFEDNFSGGKIGRLAVLGDALSYSPMVIPAADSQLIEQLKWTVEDVSRAFHVPLHMINVGNPTYQNIATLTQSYYTQTLQSLIESMELAIGEGLNLPSQYEVSFDLEALLRMDTMSRYDAWGKAIASGWMSPNEARQRENMAPVEGGDTPYLQQQNWSLAQLDKRDINAPAGGAAPGAPPGGSPGEPPIEGEGPEGGSGDVTPGDEDLQEDPELAAAKALTDALCKQFRLATPLFVGSA